MLIMEEGDYLSDPEMWNDKLPQPFRAVDHVLNGLLDAAWGNIEYSMMEREQKLAQVMVPEGASGRVVCGNELTLSNGGVYSGQDVTFIGNGNHVYVVRCRSVSSGNEEIITRYDVRNEVLSLAVVSKSGVHVIITRLLQEIKVLAYTRSNFHELIDISHHSADTMEITLSPTFSHLGVTYSSSSNESASDVSMCKLVIYSLPIDHWISELMQQVAENTVFSKATLLYYLSPPTPLTPTANNPSSVFHSVCNQNSSIIPSGKLHSLTELYFENRRKMFISKRLDFVSRNPNTIRSFSEPTCHFIYYKSAQKQATACYVATWWREDLELLVYPLVESKSTTAPPLSRRIPQASPIICSSITEDSSMLALGLKSGVVIVWDMKRGMCSGVFSCVDGPDLISTLNFFWSPSTSSGLILGIGTEQGGISALLRVDGNMSIISLNSRVEKQKEVYASMFDSSGYDDCSKVVCFKFNPHFPSLLITVHVNGALMVWNHVECEAVCRFLCGNNYSISSPSCCAVTSDGNHILIAGDLEEADSKSCSVLCFDLCSMPSIKKYCTNHSEENKVEPHGKKLDILDAAEIHLQNYIKLRDLEMDNNIIKWQERWKELPNILKKQYSTT